MLGWLIWLAACTANSVPVERAGSGTRASPAPPTAAVATDDVAAGRAIFNGETTIAQFVACRSCHHVEVDQGTMVGPNLAGVAIRAGSRIAGVAAADYVRRSVMRHDDYVVEGFQPGLVRSVVGRDFGEILTPPQLDQLVAYLMTLDTPAAVQATSTASTTVLRTATSSTMIAGMGSAAAMTTVPSATRVATAATTPPATATVATTPPATATVAPTNAPTTALPTLTAAATAAPTATAPPSPTAPTVAEASATTVPATATDPPPTPSSAPPTPLPTPTIAPTVPPAPTAPSAPTAPPAPPPASDGELAVYENCMSCHAQHAASVVSMPHPRFPPCSSCHSGSPNQVGCPTCHSMHRVVSPHPSDPNLACNTCHGNM